MGVIPFLELVLPLYTSDHTPDSTVTHLQTLHNGPTPPFEKTGAPTSLIHGLTDLLWSPQLSPDDRQGEALPTGRAFGRDHPYCARQGGSYVSRVGKDKRAMREFRYTWGVYCR